jgi:phosphatidylserine decarboxylase
MLDSLGSTLSMATVKTFFERNGKDPNEQELTVDEMVQCLEKEVSRPCSERKSINLDEPTVEGGSGTTTPMIHALDVETPAPSPRFDKLDFSGPPLPSQPGVHSSYQGTNNNNSHNHNLHNLRDQAHLRKPSCPPAYWTEPSQQPVLNNLPPPSSESSPSLHPRNLPQRENSGSSSEAEDLSSGGSTSQNPPEDVERVINVKTCPLCHRPRLNSKAEMDIVTHIAVCASQDWNRVDRIVVGNFVTPSQAQRKWLMKVISKVSSGAYQIGAVSVFHSIRC